MLELSVQSHQTQSSPIVLRIDSCSAFDHRPFQSTAHPLPATLGAGGASSENQAISHNRQVRYLHGSDGQDPAMMHSLKAH